MAANCSKFVDFPSAEVLGPDASEEAIKAMIRRHGSVFVKPVFRGGVGKKGKAGLLAGRRTSGRAGREERLYASPSTATATSLPRPNRVSFRRRGAGRA